MKINLDLLPQNKKNEIKKDKLFRAILHKDFLFLFPLLVLIALLANVYYLLRIQRDNELASFTTTQGQEQYQQLNKYDEDFKKINEATNALLEIQAGHLQWSDVLARLSTDVPEGIRVESLATKNYNVYLIGQAKSRDGLLEFKAKLEQDDCFETVNVPLSNLVVKENIDFQMDFLVKQACLKK
jgi:Tfp pilus assembly protein PilN